MIRQLPTMGLLLLLAAGCTRPRPASESSAQQPAPPAAAASQAGPCDSATSQLAMTACQAEEAKRADSLEVEQYAAARQALQSKGVVDQLPVLEAAEQAWKAYREAQCQAEAGLYAGGSAAPMMRVICQGRLARSRTEELKQVYAEWAKQ